MGENYGNSFAQKLIKQEKYAEAVEAATRDADRDAADPVPVFDRACAWLAQERWAEAVIDLEKAIVLDEREQMLETDFVDDALFGALLGEARATKDVSAAVVRLGHYREVFPAGRHVADVDTWSRRIRGEGANDVIVKERLEG